MIEFASNVATFAFTELFAFMINYDFNFRMSFNSSDIETVERLSIKERVLTQKTSTITKKMKNIWKFIKKKLTNTQDTQKKYVDQKNNSHRNTRSKTWFDCSSRISRSSAHSENWIISELISTRSERYWKILVN
jgi:tRNA G10  N-methylase Trm11